MSRPRHLSDRTRVRLGFLGATTLAAALVPVPSAHGQAQAAALTLMTTPGTFVAGDQIGVRAEVRNVDQPATISIELFDQGGCTGDVLGGNADDPFEIDALRGAFTFSFDTNAAGTYSWRVTLTEGIGEDDTATQTKCSQNIPVGKATPTVATMASNAAADGEIRNTATLANRINGPSLEPESITFSVYAPGDADCTRTPVDTSTSAVSIRAQTYTSDDVDVDATGVYKWKVTYSGDDNNAAVTVGCGVGASTVAAESEQLPPAAATPRCDGKPATIVGTNGNDRLRGTAGRDVIVARGGNDDVDGRGGNDLICGGAGRDLLRGGTDSDVVFGGSGNDDIRGGSGNDALFGNGGNDELSGGAGRDRLVGGAGRDSLAGGKGRDTGNGGGGRDSFAGVERRAG